MKNSCAMWYCLLDSVMAVDAIPARQSAISLPKIPEGLLTHSNLTVKCQLVMMWRVVVISSGQVVQLIFCVVGGSCMNRVRSWTTPLLSKKMLIDECTGIEARATMTANIAGQKEEGSVEEKCPESLSG